MSSVRTDQGLAGGLISPIRALLLASLKGLFVDVNLKKNRNCTVSIISIQPINNQHLIRAPLKGVTQITVVFFFDGFINFLILYVFANLGFIQADRADIISTGPKTVASKIPLQSAEFFKDNHCAFTFEISYDG